MKTRAEWETEKAAEQQRTGLHGFNPGMPWAVAYWYERAGIVLFYAIGWGVVFPAMLGGMLWLIGSMGEGISRYNVEHDRCLKHATNGYEIKRCH